MRGITIAIAAGVFAVAMSLAPTALAGDSISWVWNSSDADAKAKFKAYGDHIILCKVGHGHMKVNYKTRRAEGTHHHDGDQHTCKDFNHNFREGMDVDIQVCQVKRFYPDDCSDWHDGEA
ncbi:hypothetical protein [Solicola gregarius]|uniref:Uncharacterized protein n=1 Tax=Solicola gregarius TaxID=2908642 RepID=A0AA46TLS6_9ACTN|nr:hypothetical protein [Solicola gregarius]UYM06773.1 hypothetical protein L0C25_06785 [Solicola gregarius]